MKLVLCHGLLGFDTLNFIPVKVQRLLYGQSSVNHVLGLSYWGRNLVRHLEQECSRINGQELDAFNEPRNVWIPRVPATACVEVRAAALHAWLDRKTSHLKEPTDVHLIAHSMGGLDSRYMLSKLQPLKMCRIASLTTLSTPHRGSSYIDWLMELGHLQHLTHDAVKDKLCNSVEQNKDWFAALESFLLSLPVLASDIRAFRQLSKAYASINFSQESLPDNSKVKYFSYGSSVPSAKNASFGQKLSWRIIRDREGENDGLVSVKSAKWDEYCGTLQCNHDDLVAIWPWRRTFDAQSFMSKHLERLRKLET